MARRRGEDPDSPKLLQDQDAGRQAEITVSQRETFRDSFSRTSQPVPYRRSLPCLRGDGARPSEPGGGGTLACLSVSGAKAADVELVHEVHAFAVALMVSSEPCTRRATQSHSARHADAGISFWRGTLACKVYSLVHDATLACFYSNLNGFALILLWPVLRATQFRAL